MSDPGSATVGVGEGEEERGWRRYLKRIGDWFAYKNKGEWLKDMKGSLSMTASIIATMTFQLATNPPGGVVQVSAGDNFICASRNGSVACPGGAVSAIVYPDTYSVFLVYNTISFVASLSVCLLLVSGIPLNHRFPTWLLSIGMCIAVTSLAFTYKFAVTMVTPDSIYDRTYNGLDHVGLTVWFALLGLVGVFLIIRLFVWGVNKCSS